MNTKAGIAIAEARAESCSGCYMSIPPQVYVNVKKNESIITCPNCNRILYYKEAIAQRLPEQRPPPWIEGCSMDKGSMKELTIYTDGASRNNPGEAGAGVSIMSAWPSPGRDLAVSGNDHQQYR